MKIDRSKRPKSSGDIQFKIPQIKFYTLGNGLNTYFVKKNDLPIIRINLIINCGSKYDPVNLKGLNNLLAMCIDEGAGDLNSLQLSDAFEMLGAQFSISTDSDVIFISLQVLKENFLNALKLFAIVLTKPHFNELDFKREQNKVLVKLKQLVAEPDYLADAAFEYFLFKQPSPYAFPTLGIDRTVSKINVELLRKNYATNFSPLNSTLVVVGNIEWDELQLGINSAIGDWDSKLILNEETVESIRSERKVYIINKAGAVQTEIRTGHLTSKRSQKDFFQKQILNLVLGGQFSSRLNLNLREKNGYTYGIHSRFNYWKDSGYFGISTSVDTDITNSALKEIFYEANNIRNGITLQEMIFAKSSLIKRFPSNFETYRQIAGNLTSKVLHNLPDNYFDNYITSINSLSLDDINKVGTISIFSEEFVTVLVGDSQKILEQIKGAEFGEIKIVEFDNIFQE